MTPEQQHLIKTSFSKIAPIADTAATLFYDDLFARDPRLRALFKDDMAEQRKKLMLTLSVVVQNVSNWDAISMTVRSLGRRHVTYGVSAGDYATVGSALIATLEKGLGSDFTPEVREAWTACITALAAEMVGATAGI
jgi:hemoglobin-like flavoprotein